MAADGSVDGWSEQIRFETGGWDVGAHLRIAETEIGEDGERAEDEVFHADSLR